MMLCLATVLSPVFENYPIVHQVIRILGVLFLLYFAWRLATTSINIGKKRARPLSFLQASAFQWVNGKSWAIMTSAIATYTVPGDNISWQLALMLLIFTALCFASVTFWSAMGYGLKKYMTQARLRIFNLLMAPLLVLSIFPTITQIFSH